jgi:hypothetical protein
MLTASIQVADTAVPVPVMGAGGRTVAARRLEEADAEGRRRREETRRFRRDPGLRSQTPTTRS